MPSKYIIRSFSENNFYHVFNRGVEKRAIFTDPDDYQMFKYYLFVYLAPLDLVVKKHPTLRTNLKAHNLNKEVELAAYCLMPNHFHLLLKQTSKDSISKFMKQLTNAYTKYFNDKYQRTGSLLEGRFKAALVNTDELLMHVSRYIHLNPLVANLTKDLKKYRWSSFNSYVNNFTEDFCAKKTILDYFKSEKEYKKFVNDQASYAKELHKIKHLGIDNQG